MDNIQQIRQAVQLLRQAARDVYIDDLDHRADFLGAIEVASRYAHKAIEELLRTQLNSDALYGISGAPRLASECYLRPDLYGLEGRLHGKTPVDGQTASSLRSGLDPLNRNPTSFRGPPVSSTYDEVRELAELEGMHQRQRDRSKSPPRRALSQREDRRDRSPTRRRGYEDLRRQYEDSANNASDFVSSLMQRLQRLSPGAQLAKISEPAQSPLAGPYTAPDLADLRSFGQGEGSQRPPSPDQVLLRRDRSTQPRATPQRGLLGAVMNRLRPMASSIFGGSPPACLRGGDSKRAAITSASDLDRGCEKQGRNPMQAPSVLGRIPAASLHSRDNKHTAVSSAFQLTRERHGKMHELMQAPLKRSRSPIPSPGSGDDGYGDRISKRMKPTLQPLPSHMLREMDRHRLNLLQAQQAMKAETGPLRRAASPRSSNGTDDYAMEKAMLRKAGGGNLRRDLGNLRDPVSSDFQRLEDKLRWHNPRNPSASELQRFENELQQFDRYKPSSSEMKRIEEELRKIDERNPSASKLQRLEDELRQLDPRTPSAGDLRRLEDELRQIDEAILTRTRQNAAIGEALAEAGDRPGTLKSSRHGAQKLDGVMEREPKGRYSRKNTDLLQDRLVTRASSKYDAPEAKRFSPPTLSESGHKRRLISPVEDELLVGDDAKSFSQTRRPLSTTNEKSSLSKEEFGHPATMPEPEVKTHKPSRTGERVELPGREHTTNTTRSDDDEMVLQTDRAKIKKQRGDLLTTDALNKFDRIVEVESGKEGSGYGSEDESEGSSILARWLEEQEEKERMEARGRSLVGGESGDGDNWEPEW